MAAKTDMTAESPTWRQVLSPSTEAAKLTTSSPRDLQSVASTKNAMLDDTKTRQMNHEGMDHT